MGDKSWKELERVVGRAFGAMRQPGSGSMNRPDRSRADVKHPGIFFEAKRRTSYAPLIKALEPVRKQAQKEGRVGIIQSMTEHGLAVAVYLDDLGALAGAIDDCDETFLTVASRVRVAVVPRLRVPFKMLDDTFSQAEDEAINIAVVAVRVPKKNAIILVMYSDDVEAVALWHYAGLQIVADRGGALTDAEKETLQMSPGKINFRECYERLDSYQHSWHPPKKRKKAKPKPEENEFVQALPKFPPATAATTREPAAAQADPGADGGVHPIADGDDGHPSGGL